MKALLILTLILTSCSSFVGIREVSSVSSDLTCHSAIGEFSIAALSPERRSQRFVRHNKSKNIPIHIDLGGEGRYSDAININPNAYTTTTGEWGERIPFWVKGRSDHIPFESNSVDKITVENSPINNDSIKEMLRVLRPRGDIYLSHPSEYAQQIHPLVVDAFKNTEVIQKTLEYNTITIIKFGNTN